MFRYGTIHDWWRAARQYDCLRYIRNGLQRKCVLKCLGYGHVLNQIEQYRPLRILEFGHGPTSPLFDLLDEDIELWGLDHYSTTDCYPPHAYDAFRKAHPRARFELGYLGKSVPALPSGYFDMVCSVSVIEHIPPEQLADAFSEIHRILRPGGIVANSTDICLGQSLDALYDAHVRNGFAWHQPAQRTPPLNPHEVMMEDPRAVMEVYMQHKPAEQRRWPGNFVSLLSVARKERSPGNLRPGIQRQGNLRQHVRPLHACAAS